MGDSADSSGDSAKARSDPRQPGTDRATRAASARPVRSAAVTAKRVFLVLTESVAPRFQRPSAVGVRSAEKNDA